MSQHRPPDSRLRYDHKVTFYGEGELLYSIHALRLLAALAVIVYHSATWFGDYAVMVGAAGVDVFFVISGVVIALSTKPEETVSDFCAKRFIRVMPLYWLATAAVLILAFSGWGRVPPSVDLLHTIFLLPGPGWIPPYFPAWTLCFEMMFYAVYAILLGALRRDVTLIAALLMGGLAATHLPVLDAPNYYFPSDFCIEFAFGLLLAAALKRGMRIDRTLGAACIIASVALFAWNHGTPSTRVLGWGLPAFFLVAGVISFEKSTIFKSRILVFGGAASYALYLFHATAIDVTIRVAATFDVALNAYPVISLLLFIAASIAVGSAVHRWIEAPMLKWLRTIYRWMANPLALPAPQPTSSPTPHPAPAGPEGQIWP
jgi:exopolysaccharide production protein ExoZ